MADGSNEELSSSWCLVDRDGKNIDQVKETTAEESTIPASAQQEAPEDGLITLRVDTPGDRTSLVPTPDISMESEDASSDHSDFEVFEKDCGGETEAVKGHELDEVDEEEEEVVDADANKENAKKDSASGSVSSVSHEQRIRLALNNLRGGDGQPQMPTPLESPQVEESAGNEGNQQAAEPPRVQIIRLNADEESLPESDIQLEEAQGAVRGLFVQEQYDVMLDGGRVRRYQHLPNPNLNARLNNLALGALLFVIGLAVGHFIGSTHERFSQHFQRVDCLDRVKSVQNELLRCARKYDEMELQLNEVKATLVQKEYVDKWESLYQEGEEEKATLTATMNLYKNRYMKQQQQLNERLDRIKSVQNDLLRCTLKYEQLELKQNEQKATLVQKEYVDKWESLYQEGEEEKAALTATMNLYKSRYNKQKQLLTQCEVHYQDLQEQFNKLKMGKTNIYTDANLEPELPPLNCDRCERQNDALSHRLRDLEGQLSNCSQQKPVLNATDHLLLFLQPLLRLNGTSALPNMNFTFLKSTSNQIGNNTQLILAKLQEKFNFTSNMTRLAGDWLNSTFLSGNNSDKFAKWLSGVRDSVNATEFYDTLFKASVTVSDKVEKLFDILSAAMKNVTRNTRKKETTEDSKSLLQQVKAKLTLFGNPLGKESETAGESMDQNKEKLGFHTLSTAWRKTLQSTREAWEAGVKKAKGVLKDWKEPGRSPSPERPSETSPKETSEPHEAVDNDAVKFSKRKLSSLSHSEEVPTATSSVKKSGTVENTVAEEGNVTKTSSESEAVEDNVGKTSVQNVEKTSKENVEKTSEEEVEKTSKENVEKTLEPNEAGGLKTKEAPGAHDASEVNESQANQKPQNMAPGSNWFDKRAEARRSYHDIGPGADWYWKTKHTDRDPKSKRLKDDQDDDVWLKEYDEQFGELEPWPDTFWYTRRRMGRAEQRVKKILRFLNDRVAFYKWMEKRKKLRANARKRRKNSDAYRRRMEERRRFSRRAAEDEDDGDDDDDEDDRD